MKRFEVVFQGKGQGYFRRPMVRKYLPICFISSEVDVPEYYWTLYDRNGQGYNGKIYCNGLVDYNDYRNFEKEIPASVRKDIKEACGISTSERVRFSYQ